MSDDTLRVSLDAPSVQFEVTGDHIITSAKHSHNIWRSQIHNSVFRGVIGFADFIFGRFGDLRAEFTKNRRHIFLKTIVINARLCYNKRTGDCPLSAYSAVSDAFSFIRKEQH